MLTLISGALGLFGRLIPEILKAWNKKQEMAHELALQDKALEFQKLKGNQVVEEIQTQGQADYNVAALDTLAQAIKAQEAPSGVKWIDGLSKLIRPLIAFQWCILLYPGVIVTTFIVLIQSGTPTIEAMNKVFGPEEKAVVAFVLDFYFLGRVLDKVKGK